MSRHPPIPSGPGLDTETYWKAIAAAKLGALPQDLLWTYHSFAFRGELGLTLVTAGAGGRSQQGKALRITTNAGASGECALLSTTSAAATAPQAIPTGSSSKWWIGSYFKVATAMGAAGWAGVGAFAPGVAVEVLMGGYGAVSTANFVCYSINASINSGRALDTNFRMHQAWRDGTAGFYQIDTDAPVSGDIRPTTGSQVYADAFDTAAVERAADLVFWAAATVKP